MATEDGEVISKAKIPVDAGRQKPSTARKWTREQIKYKNFAGMVDALDQMALQFVYNRREQFRARMSGPMQRWAVNWSAANTEVMWHERPDDVHIPETKKALDGKVARIEEAVTGFDPVFEAEGTKGEVSRRTAKVIGSYVYRQMEMADWKRFVQPVAKDGELCNIMAIKVQYERHVEDIIERNDQLAFNKNGEPEYQVERRMRKAVTREGCTLRLVDPFWFIYDVDADSPQECAYIGDESIPFMHELEQLAEQGLYSKEAVKRVKEDGSHKDGAPPTDSTSRAHYVDGLRRSRSIAQGPDFVRDIRAGQGAERVRVIEMWAWFDFGKGYEGVTSPTGEKLKGVQRVVITVANGIVIRLQQNPFDRKFVPYAFEMVNRTGHELVAPAPFDSVVQMNALYDRLASNQFRWFDLAVSPLIVTSDQNTDLPDSILDVEAGKVLRNTGQWDWIKVPDVTGAISYQQQYMRREMEETSGALRIHESPQGTATEVERKVQEQQRMVRSSIRANGNLWRQVALLIKAFEMQFSTGAKMFQVAGKNSRLLGRYAEITPQQLMEDVDFRFLGLTDIHVFGNRLQGMSQWMNRWGPLLQTMPKVNMQALCRMDFELSVGRAQVTEIFPDDSSPWEAWSQEEENAMLLTGQFVEVHEADDDEDHIQKAQQLLMSALDKKAPKYVIERIIEHLEAHYEQMGRKEQEQKRQQQMAQENAALMAVQGGQPGTDRPPVPGGMQAPSQQRDVTPGSPQARTQSRTGRAGSGLSQTQVM